MVDKLEEQSDETELSQQDRLELDDAVLQLLGIRDPRQRKSLRERLYGWLEEYFEAARRKEEQAIVNKTIAKKSLKLTPQTLASDIFTLIESEHPALLKSYRDIAQVDGQVSTEGVRIPRQGRPEIVEDLLMTGVRFKGGKGRNELVHTRSTEQAKLVIKIFELGGSGRSYLLPIDTSVIERQIRRIDELLKARQKRITVMIEARTADAEIGRKAYDLVMARF